MSDIFEVVSRRHLYNVSELKTYSYVNVLAGNGVCPLDRLQCVGRRKEEPSIQCRSFRGRNIRLSSIHQDS